MPARTNTPVFTGHRPLRGAAFGLRQSLDTVGTFLGPLLAMLVASALAGLLWDRLGAEFTFVAGALFSAGALVLLSLRVTDSG